MRHATTHDRVLGESAARAVVAMERNERAVVVATGTAGETMAAGLERLDGHEIADLEILDTVASSTTSPQSSWPKITGLVTPVSGCGSLRVVMGPA